MYQSEINNKVEAADQIPTEIKKEFAASRNTVSLRTVLPWSEHCTECVWPTCYSTCDIYEARPDGNCRRFVDGMVRIDSLDAYSGYILKIRFKQWGKLWTFGNIRLHTSQQAAKIEKRDQSIGKVIRQLVIPASTRRFLSNKRYSLKKRLAQTARPSGIKPTSFMLECYNPGQTVIRVSLTIRSRDLADKFPFQALLDAKPGFNRMRISFQAINSVVPLDEVFHIELIPNDVPTGTTLYFGLMEFVQEAQVEQKKPANKGPKVKCVVWDLDNTLWDGILVEDGAALLRLKPGIRDVIVQLDRRGILQSIASKNNASDAMDVLKSFGLEEYFLFPQISWNPKSEAIAAILQQLNIGAETILFIDDSPFELEQVRAVLPNVQVLKADQYENLLSRSEFDVPVTEESANRRKMYVVEGERQTIAGSFGDDYKAFLKHCDIRMNLSPMTTENIERVHELTQRTNQMNFSGNRYERSRLEEILHTRYLDTYVIRCEDKFGSYGVVGFAIVDKREPRLTDLMFSCRIQGKRVEHAFLSHIIDKYTSGAVTTFYANYRKTKRNEPSGKVFADLGFRESSIRDGVSLLMISRNDVTSDEPIIRVLEASDTIPAWH